MKKIKLIAALLLALSAASLLTGCKKEETPYEINNKDNYTVSVKFDANGGVFTTNTSVIVSSYNVADMKANSEGIVEIPLISPDNENRGNDAFTAVKNGYFLAGWYQVRNESVDADGNTVYSYSDKWDFENDVLTVEQDGNYSAETPVMTLYAAWVPLFEIEFYSLDSKEYLDKFTFDPTLVEAINVPAWDEETGAIEMYDFPEKSGYTFNKVYYDEAGTELVETDTITHAGVLDIESGTAQNSVMKLYVEWVEGEWYHIYNAEQFLENANVNGNYEIHADLDFTDEIWPTSLMYGNFTGTIIGNGHTFKNIELTQTNNSKVNAGLFGNLTETAAISDLTFENVTFTIQAGTRMTGTSFGLMAGTISGEAELTNVKILESALLIDSDCYFGVDDYSIGLVCGMGDTGVIPDAEITCSATGTNPENVSITLNGNAVAVTFETE